jgi:choline dehydrogenase-like flavoprotein
MKRAIVVGSGAGGATAAKELQGIYDVTVLESGRDFQPLSFSLPLMETVEKLGVLRDEREIPFFFPSMRVRKTAEGMILVNGEGVGGTTTIATGNAVRQDQDLKAIGLDLDAEFAELAREIPISTDHQTCWRPITQQLFTVCQNLGLDPQSMPKMGTYDQCRHCGRCVFGCPAGVKWDSRQFLQDAVAQGARLLTGCRVERLVLDGHRATGVEVQQGWTRWFCPADLIVIAAGGLATPVILQRSGIATEPNLFVDPVLCVAAESPDCQQCFELQMPFVVQRDRYIVSPYFDYVSFLFNREWRRPAKDTLSLMIKLADSGGGTIVDGRVEKALTQLDRDRLNEGVALCEEILGRTGVIQGATFQGTLNAGHPGGMLPLTAREAETLHHHRLPENVYVADATLIPHSLGNPPSLTIMALAKRVGKLCRERLGGLPSNDGGSARLGIKIEAT